MSPEPVHRKPVIKDPVLKEPVLNIAIFDLDYTLTQRGTWGRFVVQCVKGRPWVWLPVLVQAGLAQLKYKQGKAERVTVKQAMIRAGMAGFSKEKLQDIARKFAQNEVSNGLRPGGIRALDAHRQAGDVILIVSAAADIIVKEIADLLDIEHWIATDMGWDEQARLIPEFESPNCYGAEKVRRVQSLFTENALFHGRCKFITMYSDSYSDLEILTFADVGVAVNPDSRLRAYALERDMRLEDWTE